MDGAESIAHQSGEWTNIPLGRTRSQQLLRYLHLTFPLLLLLVGTLVVVAPVWQPGFPWGSDSWGHLHRAAYMKEAIEQHGWLDGIVQSAWMTDWYLGDPTRVYYPPLTVWILGPLSVLVGNVFLAYRLFVTGILLALGVSVYVVGYRWGRNRWSAAIGALLAVMAPYTLRTIFAEGNFARGLAIVTLPWILWYTEVLLNQKKTNRALVVLALMWGLTLVAHVMQAAIFAVAVGLFVMFRILNNVYIPVRRGVLALATIAIGLGVAAIYLLPAYSHAELSNVPALPVSKIDLFSISGEALLPYHQSIEAISIGLLTGLFALVVTFHLAREHQKALFLVGVLCVWLAFGPAGGIYQIIPLNQSLLPERFLNASAIIFPLIITTVPNVGFRRIWLVTGLILIVGVEFLPAWRVVHMRASPVEQTAIAEELAGRSLPGRVAPLTQPNPTSAQIFLTSEIGQRDNVSGWALENTPHQDAIQRLLTASRRAPAYLQRMLALWNVDYLVTRFEDAGERAAVIGYHPVAEAGSLQLWERTVPSHFAQILPDNRMLVIGDNATSWLFAFPFATEGQFADPAAYSPNYLARYSVIGLSRISEGSNVESALLDWVGDGNTLIVDLSGVGSIFDQGFTLFDVHAFPFALEESPRLRWSSELSSMPDRFAVDDSQLPWVGATYYGLDETLATLTYEGETYPVLGYRDAGRGRVWYVGFNLLYWLDISGQSEATATLVDYLLNSMDVDRNLVLPALDIENLERDATQVSFRYTGATDTSAILSMTYFPRWQATIDDRPLKLKSHEHLVLLDLPAGTHTVKLQYRWLSPIVLTGGAVSLLALGMLLVSVIYIWRHPVLAVRDRMGNFEDRLPAQPTTPEPTFGYTTCPNCGSEEAITGPPTEETYPFVSLECPDCGYKG